MALQLRPYQQEAVNAVYAHLRERDDNPCVVICTGGGKSIIIGKIASDAVSLWNGRVLILAHVKELLEQNAGKVKALCPDIPVGIYSAGLGSRDTNTPIVVAGIQSVYNKADALGAFDLIIVDEAHLIAPDGEGMYRTFLNDMKLINPNVRVIGFTATPYRLKGGLICKPENILNTVCYEMGVKEMIQQGYLSPLVTRSGKKEVNLSGLHVRGGEFINTEIVAAMDKEEVTNAACSEIVRLAEDRKSVLIFATSVEHRQHIADRLRHLGQECAIITGDTPAGERAELLDRFKGKIVPSDLLGGVKPPLKYLVNVNVLTTGFDAPNTDCVVLLRPTASPGLLVQMVGRGFRLSPETEKQNTLVLDYGENILRHGPIDCITVKEQGKGKGEAPAKKCPECLALIHAGYGKCPECGYEFPPPETSNLSHKASSAGILSGQSVFTDYAVNKVFYSVHSKKNADETVPRTMRIDYEIGSHQYKSEWVCPEHSGYARSKFIKWWGERCALGCDVPKTAKEAVEAAESGLLAVPKSIRVKAVTGEKFERICGWELGERPVMREPGEDDISDWQSNSPADLGVNHDWEPFDDEIPF
jgi:DNA repair protein RadD